MREPEIRVRRYCVDVVCPQSFVSSDVRLSKMAGRTNEDDVSDRKHIESATHVPVKGWPEFMTGWISCNE